MSQSQSRRQFVKIALGVGGFAVLAPAILQAEERRKAKPAAGGAAGAGDAASAPLVVPGSPGLATNLHYVHKNTDVKDAALKTERSGVPFAQQSCSKCMLYTAAGKKGADEVGNCTLFSGQLVKASGWCTSWAKKG